MTFEEWWDAGYSNQVDMDCARQAWDFQQARIDDLLKLQEINKNEIDQLDHKLKYINLSNFRLHSWINELKAKVEWLQSIINNNVLPKGLELKIRKDGL